MWTHSDRIWLCSMRLACWNSRSFILKCLWNADTAQFLSGSGETQLRWGEWISFQICALIISSCNNGSKCQNRSTDIKDIAEIKVGIDGRSCLDHGEYDAGGWRCRATTHRLHGHQVAVVHPRTRMSLAALSHAQRDVTCRPLHHSHHRTTHPQPQLQPQQQQQQQHLDNNNEGYGQRPKASIQLQPVTTTSVDSRQRQQTANDLQQDGRVRTACVSTVGLSIVYVGMTAVTTCNKVHYLHQWLTCYVALSVSCASNREQRSVISTTHFVESLYLYTCLSF